MRNRFVIGLSLVMLSGMTLLSACSTQDVENAAKQLEELNDVIGSYDGDFKDPESVVDYLKDISSEEIIEEEEEPVNYISYNVSKIGYMPDGDQFAIRVDTEPEVAEYKIVTCEEAKEGGATVVTKPNLYGNAATDYMDTLFTLYDNVSKVDENSINNLVMNAADAMLYLEYFEDGAHADRVNDLAITLVETAYKWSESNIDKMDNTTLYNSSAILAQGVYILDIDNEDEIKELSLKLWEKAEEDNIDDEESINGCRAFAAAQLYRMTRQRTYRTIVEAIADNDSLHGVSFDNPGYYGMFAYLSADESTDYGISGKMMNHFFRDVNSKIKEQKDGILEMSLDPDNTVDGVPSLDFINRMIDDCKLSIMANYISLSVEYTGFAKTRVTYLTGANVTGANYLDAEHMEECEPALFIFCGLTD